MFEGKTDLIRGDDIVPDDGSDAVSGDDTTDDGSFPSGDAVPSTLSLVMHPSVTTILS